jgi:SAM-dependent methyltransferase
MPWYHGVVERLHEIQNPTSAEKIRLLGERLRLGPDSAVLDVASGRGGPALILAATYGCRITCVERAEEFHDAAVVRVRDAGLDHLIDLVRADARAHPMEEARYDAVLCLGASFIWGGLPETLASLTPAARRGGSVAIGEPYWRTWPLPAGFEPEDGEDFVTLAETVGRFRAAGLTPTALIDGSFDDWDQYESLHWLAAEEWLRANPDDPDAEAIRVRSDRFRERYLRWERDLVGWAIVLGRRG